MEFIKGLVSIVIPTYKRCDMLKRAIDSVLSQTYSEIELIVVNDNTKNDEWSKKLYQLIESYSDRRLVFIEQEKHINGAAARNYGIVHSRGEYICFLDDDEYFESTKIELQVKEFLNLDDSWGAVTCLKKYYKEGKLYRASLPFKDGFVFKNIIYSTLVLSTAAPLIRKKALNETGFFDTNLKRMQDIQFYSFLSNKFKIRLIKKHLLCIETSDDQNRKSLKDELIIRDAFMQSIDPLLEQHWLLKKKVILHHNFRIGINFAKEKKFLKTLKYTIPSLLLVSVFIKEIGYYFKIIKESRKKDKIIKKYGTH